MSSMRVTSGASAPVFVVAENPAAVAIVMGDFFLVEAREGDPKNVTAKSQFLCFVTRSGNFAAQSKFQGKIEEPALFLPRECARARDINLGSHAGHPY
jgi:hypothetical protein